MAQMWLVSCLWGARLIKASQSKQSIEAILRQILDWHQRYLSHEVGRQRPYVTACFAQSLDGFLAPDQTSNHPLSGPDSLQLTHALRSVHDGILVGGNTLAIDNPRLNNRLWGDGHSQPRPIVLDTQLRHLKHLGTNRLVQSPLVCCSEEAAKYASASLVDVDVELVPCSCNENGLLDLNDVLFQLCQRGIQRLMVEGGPALLSSLFHRDLVDAVCITVAPRVFSSGLRSIYGPRIVSLTDQLESLTLPLGSDWTVVCQWPKRNTEKG